MRDLSLMEKTKKHWMLVRMDMIIVSVIFYGFLFDRVSNHLDDSERTILLGQVTTEPLRTDDCES
jgi:hypothetical protein